MHTYAHKPAGASGADRSSDSRHSRQVKALLNRGAGRKAVQTKMQVGKANDRYEREADQVAQRVTADTPQAVSISPLDMLAIQRMPEGAVATRDEEEELLQASADGPVGEPDSHIERGIGAARGGGESLTAATRSYFEPRFGTRFADTRIHDSPSAHRLASDLGARAFTTGSDVFFNAGEYQPDTRAGQQLLAHELTHVVQQRRGGGAVQPKLIQRDTTAPQPTPETPAAPAAVAGDKTTGLVDTAAGTITWSSITVPTFKNRGHRGTRYQALSPLRRGQGERVDRSGENDPAQRDNWLTSLDKSTIREELENKLKTANAGEMPAGDQHVFEVRTKAQQNRYYVGSLDSLATEFLIPTWGGRQPRAEPRFFHVDHIVELQLANWPHSPEGNALENYELLEGNANTTSGRMVREAISDKISGFIRATDGAYGDTEPDIKRGFTLVFEGARGSGGPSVGNTDFWERSDIESGAHLSAVVAADPTKIGGPGLARIFSRANGGVSREFTWSGDTTAEQEVPSSLPRERYWLKPLVITHKYFRTEPESVVETPDFGYLRVHVSQRDKVFKSTEPVDLPLNRFIGARYGGILQESLRTTISGLKADHFSPITFNNIDVAGDRGIVAEGNIDVSLPFFSEATTIGIRLGDGTVSVFKEFSTDDIAVPAPFSVDECSLRVSYSLDNDWSLDGRVSFGIENVGQGEITASLLPDTGLAASGEFNFESTLFNPATLTVGYSAGAWSFGGMVGFEEGLIPGVTDGTISVNWAEGVLTGNGEVGFSYPWLSRGTLNLAYGEARGLEVRGGVELTGEVPGLNSGTVNVVVSKNTEGVWALGGSIEADLDTSRVPGLTETRFSGSLENGIFNSTLRSAFERNIASGTVTVGVTNQAIDAEGNPIEGQATEALVFYGSGSVTLALTPWLDATAGVEFARDGGISLRGAIEVTEDIEILSDEQTPDLELPRSRRPSFDVDIPLASIGVADVALRLGGSLNAYVRTSPFTLQDVRLNVFYDFDDPNATTVEGNAGSTWTRRRDWRARCRSASRPACWFCAAGARSSSPWGPC
ncbi:DUF4157 domain-containing protein [Marinobacterium aestuariivivens]|uniref:DUF4157 domain-containing protein n=1 Tax=Marinobacterium aestuariivivens TaxID=1698799 RepID=A0ABW2A195_9GAMM